MRRTPLTRRTPLARGGTLARGTGLTRRRRAVDRSVLADVVRRDGGCVARTIVVEVACWGRLDPHHVLRRSQGGSDDPSNLVTLCRAHHSWVHDNVGDAVALGLLRKAHDRPAETF